MRSAQSALIGPANLDSYFRNSESLISEIVFYYTE